MTLENIEKQLIAQLVLAISGTIYYVWKRRERLKKERLLSAASNALAVYISLFIVLAIPIFLLRWLARLVLLVLG
jgi:hypothetical protein